MPVCHAPQVTCAAFMQCTSTCGIFRKQMTVVTSPTSHATCSQHAAPHLDPQRLHHNFPQARHTSAARNPLWGPACARTQHALTMHLMVIGTGFPPWQTCIPSGTPVMCRIRVTSYQPMRTRKTHSSCNTGHYNTHSSCNTGHYNTGHYTEAPRACKRGHDQARQASVSLASLLWC